MKSPSNSVGITFLLALGIVSTASLAARMYHDVNIASAQVVAQTTELACHVSETDMLVR